MCYSLWYNAPTMLPGGGRQHRGCIIPQAVTQSSAPEDGRNNRPKHVELIGIINKPLLLHLVGCLYYLYQYAILNAFPQEQWSCDDALTLRRYVYLPSRKAVHNVS